MGALSELKTLDGRQWNAVIAAFLGWMLDAFDFFLMSFMFTAIAKEFHAELPTVIIASTLTLAARPFGAYVFGHLADRFGRRPILMLNVVLFAGVEFASAFAPSLAVLLALRALFGFAMGGEWGVGASLAMESIPAKARGVVSGFLQEGYAAGYLLAAVVSLFLFERIGWRGMFMVGVAPAFLALYLRLGVRESPAFEAAVVARPPARGLASLTLAGLVAFAAAMGPALLALSGHLSRDNLWRWIYWVDAPIALIGFYAFRKHWKLALYVIGLMTAFNFFSHGTQDLYPTFLEVQHKMDNATRTTITAIMNVGAITGGLLFGAWSQTVGRRRAIVVACLLALPVLPLWAFSHGVVLLTVGAFLMQVMVQGAWGVVPAHLNELSPPEARGAFPGFAYQVGNLLASGNAVLQADLAHQRGDNYALALALVAGVVAVVIALVTWFGPERREATLTAG